MTLICFILIAGLTYYEVKYYLDAQFEFKFSPDTDYDAKLKINVDITIAMPCSSKNIYVFKIQGPNNVVLFQRSRS